MLCLLGLRLRQRCSPVAPPSTPRLPQGRHARRVVQPTIVATRHHRRLRCRQRLPVRDEIFHLFTAERSFSRPHRLDAGWRKAEPKASYDAVIVGGGGHGLATAYYLATEHGISNVAVLEKGYIGSGNAGRNTTIIRSNYLLPGNKDFYELSLKLWEGLEQSSITTRW